jgi:hypothetical protein
MGWVIDKGHTACRMTQSVPRVSAAIAATILSHMGYNPHRKFTAKPFDYVLVAGAIAVAIALVIWAIAG